MSLFTKYFDIRGKHHTKSIRNIDLSVKGHEKGLNSHHVWTDKHTLNNFVRSGLFTTWWRTQDFQRLWQETTTSRVTGKSVL